MQRCRRDNEVPFFFRANIFQRYRIKWGAESEGCAGDDDAACQLFRISALGFGAEGSTYRYICLLGDRELQELASFQAVEIGGSAALVVRYLMIKSLEGRTNR